MSLINQCSQEDFISIVKNSFSIAECERKLGYNSYSGGVATLIKKRIQELNIDISHFSKQNSIRNPDNIFIENSTASQKVLRNYYIKGAYSEYKCSECGQEPFWNNKPLTLILDHKNGINNDDRLENLHWVCPNCNQQLETTGSKNRAYKNQECKNEKNIQKKYCLDCGKEISKNAIRCNACSGKQREIVLPVTRDELKNLIRTSSFTSIGKQYNVSDNAIRKWCDKYNLPRKASEIKKYSEQDWLKI